MLLIRNKKTQKGWLDTTVLTNQLRVCNGYKGTTFELLKRDDLSIAEFLNPIKNLIRLQF